MFFQLFWIFPLVAGFMWLGMLVAMFAVWEAEGSPYYASYDPGQHIAYISDVGAQGLKPLFMTGCIITGVFLDLALISERWLRHKGRLARVLTVMERVLVSLSLLFALLGTAGIILLSIFDTLRHPSLHDLFLLFFIVGYIGNAIFVTWEYQRLGVHYRQHRILRISFWIKLTFIVVEIILAIAYGVCLYRDRPNQGAVLEWVIALIFSSYPLSFFIDLLPTVRFKHHADLYQGDSRNGTAQMPTLTAAEQEHSAGGYYSNGQPSMTSSGYYANGQQSMTSSDYPLNNGNGNPPPMTQTRGRPAHF